MTTPGPNTDTEQMAAQLEATGEYRVLRKFRPRRTYSTSEGVPTMRALVVDVETTGLDTRTDAVIELAAVPFTYVPAGGKIVEVEPSLVFLEDPGRAIPKEIIDLTGITDDMVCGRKIDDDAVVKLVDTVDLVIAHNASFDRGFLDRRLPVFKAKPWACSVREVPWEANGRSSRALEFLLIQHCGLFFDGHRAAEDCLALVHLLATPFPSGELPLKLLLESARKKTARVWAIDSAYDARDDLKTRKYRWNDGRDGRPKSWYVEVPEERREEEEDWLRRHIYNGRAGKARVEVLDATTRYSE